jgi:hypothetical protein
MIAPYPTALPLDPETNNYNMLLLRQDVRAFFHRHHNTLRGSYGVSYGGIVVRGDTSVQLLAGDDADDLETYIKTMYPDHIVAEIVKFEDIKPQPAVEAQ